MRRLRTGDEVGEGFEGDETEAALELERACDCVAGSFWQSDGMGWDGLGNFGLWFWVGSDQILECGAVQKKRGLRGLKGWRKGEGRHGRVSICERAKAARKQGV